MSAEFELRLAPADEERLAAVAAHARRDEWARRLVDRDTTLWSTDPVVRSAIANRLGWLDAPAHFTDQIAALEGFGDGIRVAGFTTAVVMGMGGSSLAPEVLHRTFGTAEGYLDLRVLDSTDPDAVAATVDDLDPLATLWIVASKSGTTTEPLAFLADARARITAALAASGSDQNPGDFIVAITDPGKSVAAIPHHDDLRELFLNPPDIGGRYSALSYVGLVPASLIGLDLDALMTSASTMLAACHEPEPERNPGVLLGLALGTLARAGRDKLTLSTDERLSAFGNWLEQLVAESTGKLGTGIVPIVGEPPRAADRYADDRVFVHLGLGDDVVPEAATRLSALEAAGHPVVRLRLDDPAELGREFLRWELAVAAAAVILGVNPFDEPDVNEAKERARRRLESTDGPGTGDAASDPEPDAVERGLELYLGRGADANGGDLAERLRRWIDEVDPGDYVAVLAWFGASDDRQRLANRLREAVASRTGAATTLGYGPRYLHSTGQLHKGGRAGGAYLVLTSDTTEDVAVPGAEYGLAGLRRAQALGDQEALEGRGRRVARVNLGWYVEDGLAALADILGPEA